MQSWGGGQVRGNLDSRPVVILVLVHTRTVSGGNIEAFETDSTTNNITNLTNMLSHNSDRHLCRTADSFYKDHIFVY